MGGVGGAEGVADRPAQLHGLHRRRPDVLIVLDVVAVVVVIVFMVMVGVVVVIAAGQRLLGERVGVVHHPQHGGDVLSGGGENFVHPLLPLAAVIDKNVRPTHADHVHGRRLEAVGFPSGGHQQAGADVRAADLAHEVIVGEQGAHHLQPAVLRLLAGGSAGAQGQGHGRSQQKRQNPLFHCAASLHFSHRP